MLNRPTQVAANAGVHQQLGERISLSIVWHLVHAGECQAKYWRHGANSTTSVIEPSTSLFATSQSATQARTSLSVARFPVLKTIEWYAPSQPREWIGKTPLTSPSLSRSLSTNACRMRGTNSLRGASLKVSVGYASSNHTIAAVWEASHAKPLTLSGTVAAALSLDAV